MEKKLLGTIGYVFIKAERGKTRELIRDLKALVPMKHVKPLLLTHGVGAFDVIVVVRATDSIEVARFVRTQLRERLIGRLAETQTFVGFQAKDWTAEEEWPDFVEVEDAAQELADPVGSRQGVGSEAGSELEQSRDPNLGKTEAGL